LSQPKGCQSYQVTKRRGFGQGSISGTEGGRGVAEPTGVLWGQGVLGKSSRAVVGVWEVGIGKFNPVSSAINDELSMGRACGGAEARGERLLGRGLCVTGRAWLCGLRGENREGQ